jgi:hypothetical protein
MYNLSELEFHSKRKIALHEMDLVSEARFDTPPKLGIKRFTFLLKARVFSTKISQRVFTRLGLGKRSA